MGSSRLPNYTKGESMSTYNIAYLLALSVKHGTKQETLNLLQILYDLDKLDGVVTDEEIDNKPITKVRL